MCYIHVPTPQNECKHYVLQTYTNEDKNLKINKINEQIRKIKKRQ